MPKLCCIDYGFECNFVAEDEDIQLVLEKFAKHTLDEHGIEYTKEILFHFILRQKNPWIESDTFP
jgi:predicted small metal-binding protein